MISTTIRMALVRLLGRAAPGWAVADAPDAASGIARAIEAAGRGEAFDLVLLDVEMPGMSGLQAVPHLLSLRPAPRIVMVASETRRSAEITFAALQAGASDFIPKPTSHGLAGFERDLLAKAAALLAPAAPVAAAAVLAAPPSQLVTRTAIAPAPPGRGLPPHRLLASGNAASRHKASSGNHAGRLGSFDILAIGASTGGPAAVSAVLRGLRELAAIPIVITQHMPAPFLPVFAEQLTPIIGRPCSEAKAGAVLQAGQVCVAAGDRHLLVERSGHRILLRLDEGPPENFCRPAVDPMLRSVAKVYGPAALAFVLTGMGQDGAEGCAAIRAAGGRVLAQDEATSIVWGMPGAVVRRGLADAVLPLDAIAPAILAIAGRSRREVR